MFSRDLGPDGPGTLPGVIESQLNPSRNQPRLTSFTAATLAQAPTILPGPVRWHHCSACTLLKALREPPAPPGPFHHGPLGALPMPAPPPAPRRSPQLLSAWCPCCRPGPSAVSLSDLSTGQALPTLTHLPSVCVCLVPPHWDTSSRRAGTGLRPGEAPGVACASVND